MQTNIIKLPKIGTKVYNEEFGYGEVISYDKNTNKHYYVSFEKGYLMVDYNNNIV